MATGALRLAKHHDALIFPISITAEGGWRYRVKIGRAVPEELLGSEAEWPRAGRHLLDELIKAYEKFPEQCPLKDWLTEIEESDAPAVIADS
jgi:hypothetical protein